MDKNIEELLKNVGKLVEVQKQNIFNVEKKLENIKPKTSNETEIKLFLHNTILDLKNNKQVNLMGFISKINELNAKSNDNNK
jgi:hypothetical protein